SQTESESVVLPLHNPAICFATLQTQELLYYILAYCQDVSEQYYKKGAYGDLMLISAFLSELLLDVEMSVRILCGRSFGVKKNSCPAYFPR
ncbi:MAG: hypothetical protein RRY04_07990, partial [Oscillospiraceae bacterium]